MVVSPFQLNLYQILPPCHPFAPTTGQQLFSRFMLKAFQMREKIKTSSNTDKSPQITLFCLLRPSRSRRSRHSFHSFPSPMDGWRATSVISSGVEGIRHGVALPFLAFFRHSCGMHFYTNSCCCWFSCCHCYRCCCLINSTFK